MKVPDLFVGKRLFTGLGTPEVLGRGRAEVRGSAYIEGPQVIGDPSVASGSPEQFTPATAIDDGAPVGPTNGLANLMVGQCKNTEMQPKPFYALMVKTFARVMSFLKVDTLLTTETIKAKVIYSEVIMANIKNFVIPHPSKEGKNLVYACLEGPENGVYVRGRLRNSTRIELPDYWQDLVSTESITVSITPAGAHQNIIIRGVYNTHIELQSMEPFPIHCHYHVFAERKDVKKLKTEVDA